MNYTAFTMRKIINCNFVAKATFNQCDVSGA